MTLLQEAGPTVAATVTCAGRGACPPEAVACAVRHVDAGAARSVYLQPERPEDDMSKIGCPSVRLIVAAAAMLMLSASLGTAEAGVNCLPYWGVCWTQ
jgi:hypothetical protein